MLDCETMLDDPTSSLDRDMFAPAEAWLLEPGRALPLLPRHQATCEAYLIDAQGLPLTIVAWDVNEFPTQTLSTSVEEPGSDGRMIMMVQSSSELELAEHGAVFDAPVEEPFQPEPACAVPDETIGVAWSDVPNGEHTLVGITSSPDGCHSLELETSSFFVCLPLETLPLQVGENIRVNRFAVGSTGDGNENTFGEGISITSDSVVIEAAAGPGVLSPSTDSVYDVSLDTQSGCEPHHDTCGNYVTPLEVTYLGGGLLTLKAGESADREEDGSTLYLVRAQRMPIRDTECTNINVTNGELYFESVLVTPIPNEEN